MKRILCVLLIIIFLIPSFSHGSSYYDLSDNIRVFQMGIMGQGVLDLDRYITRAELATISVRLMSLEYLKDFQNKTSPFKDVKGWYLPYVNIANEVGLMNGVNKEYFNPNGRVQYIELLTVLMRILGYEDGVDFQQFPDDYYLKSLEIGLANLYIPYDEVVTRGTVATTINRALDLNIKDSELQLSSLYQSNIKNDYVVSDSIYLANLNFNTNLVGIFSGELTGTNDFSGYKVVLLSKSGNVLDSIALSKEGKFYIEGFDISLLSKLQGYKYEIYSPTGKLILWENLE